MSTDYEKFYQKGKHGLGTPTREFVEFFDSYERSGSSVLDVGCGQGRDALFIARLGHRVTGIDLSTTGIQQLKEDALVEDLPIEAVAANVVTYVPSQNFDVILIDRTLHMLTPSERLTVLGRLLEFTKPGSAVLIADETANIPSFQTVLSQSGFKWQTTLRKRGYLFVQRSSEDG